TDASLPMRRNQRGKPRAVENLEVLAGILTAQGDSERAARLLTAAETIRHALGAPVPPIDRAEYDLWRAASRAALGTEQFLAAWMAGRAMTLEEAVALALKRTP